MTISTMERMHSDASALTFLNLVKALQQKLVVDEAVVLAGGNFPDDLMMERQASAMTLSSRFTEQAISRPLTWPSVQFVIDWTSLATPRIANWKICF